MQGCIFEGGGRYSVSVHCYNVHSRENPSSRDYTVWGILDMTITIHLFWENIAIAQTYLHFHYSFCVHLLKIVSEN